MTNISFPEKAPLLTCIAISVLGFSLYDCSRAEPESSPDGNLKDGFINPPQSARPGVYWYFMDGNLSKEGMTNDLESMSKRESGMSYFLKSMWAFHGATLIF